MGDRPERIANPNSCPGSGWAGGLVPDSIIVTLTGIQKGPAWTSVYPEPPEGSFVCDFLGCVVWSFDDADYKIEASVVGTEFHVYMFSKPYSFNFATAGPIAEPYEQDNQHSSQNIYTGGSVSILDLGLTGLSYPPSWDASDLVGVPKQTGYFAEEFPSVIHNRYLRYARHSNGTNLKVWLD